MRKSGNAPLGSHVLDLDTGDADLKHDLLGIINRLILLLVLAHLPVHDSGSIEDDVAEEDNDAPTSAHAKHEAHLTCSSLSAQSEPMSDNTLKNCWRCRFCCAETT